MRASYGVSFISSKSGLYPISVTALLHSIMSLIEQHCNSAALWMHEQRSSCGMRKVFALLLETWLRTNQISYEFGTQEYNNSWNGPFHLPPRRPCSVWDPHPCHRYSETPCTWKGNTHDVTHWDLNKIAHIWQTTFINAFNLIFFFF